MGPACAAVGFDLIGHNGRGFTLIWVHALTKVKGSIAVERRLDLGTDYDTSMHDAIASMTVQL